MTFNREFRPRRVKRVSIERRPYVVHPRDDRQPVPSVGDRAYVHGLPFSVHKVHNDRVHLMARWADGKHLPVGLLVHWMSWAWRVVQAGPSGMELEAWGPCFADSPKLSQYEA